MKVCAVIPVYNHALAVGRTLAEVRAHGLPVVLVNDGSDAHCTEVLRTLAAGPGVALVELSENLGKGGAVKAGLMHALTLGYSHALQVDADGQHNLSDVQRFLDAATENPQALICGVPEYDSSIPKARLYGRYLTHVWVWINTLSGALKDSMCGFRVYPLAAVCQLLEQEYTGNRMDFDPEVLVRWFWRGGDVKQLSTRVHYPEDGVSHFLPGMDNWLISCMHARLFFGMLWRWPLWLLGLQKRGRAL
ncbi:glycosyltransferase family 2 protein [Simiduia agarivorans]|uniref:Glycosyl transferase family protein n=1 Tax=Simiduia agarivorans (strain DSM 21679 / JCM 13881 / BCRC 17597 / SA1) TaxID=1117647 RepID=K4KK35_SIMAS|nr:glycosyltransferase family 2 protein [Simiduia agarivorans]AFU98590.1 glycosyl transferase family protein [Simiduia agarivorans SA1 = DSM 21679]